MIFRSIVRGYFDCWGSVLPDLLMTWVELIDCWGQRMKKCGLSTVGWLLSCFSYASFAYRTQTPPPASCVPSIRWLQGCYFLSISPKNIKICKFSSRGVIVGSSVPSPRFYSTAPRTVHRGSWVSCLLQWSSRLRNSKNQCIWLADAWKMSSI
jgi:hypothetical protein